MTQATETERIVQVTYKSNSVSVYLKPTKTAGGFSFVIHKQLRALEVALKMESAVAAIDDDLMSAIMAAANKSFLSCNDFVIALSDNSVQDKGFTPRLTGYRSPSMRREDWLRAQDSRSEWKTYNDLVNEGGEGFNPFDRQ